MHYATTSDGVRIAYMSVGDGPPIVFASNIFGDLTNYRIGWPHQKEVTDCLVDPGWRVIRYDVRGMGYSDRNVADVEVAARVLDVQAVVAALRPIVNQTSDVSERDVPAAVFIPCAQRGGSPGAPGASGIVPNFLVMPETGSAPFAAA